MEFISVITPAYNAAATLRRACDSLRGQSVSAWEHIIVDDGSTDATPEVIRDLLADPRVSAITRPNRGTGAALNTGLDLAKGSLIAFLDADDEYLPDHLAAHMDVLSARPEVDLLWGGIEVVAGREEDTMVPDIDRGAGLISIHECVVQGTLFARRHVFSTCRFTEDRSIWWQDSELVRRVRQSYTVERFRKATYRYYRNSGQSLVDRVKQEWRSSGDDPAPKAALAGS